MKKTTKKAASTKGKKKLTPKEFTLLAIKRLKGKYKGIHTVYSGFNAAFRKYFPKLNPVKEMEKLEKAKIITIRPVKGGVLISPYSKQNRNPREEALEKMGLE